MKLNCRVTFYSIDAMRPADPRASGKPSRNSSKWMFRIPIRVDQSRMQGKNGAIQKPRGRIQMSPRSAHTSIAKLRLGTLLDQSSNALLLPFLSRLSGFQWAVAHPCERQTRSAKP